MTKNDPKDIVRLLQAIAKSEDAKKSKHDVIFQAAADLIDAIPSMILEAFHTNSTFLGNVQILSKRIADLEKGQNDIVEQCAMIADSFTCGSCGMDGKAGAKIRELKTKGDDNGKVDTL